MKKTYPHLSGKYLAAFRRAYRELGQFKLAEELQSSNTAVYKWQLGSPLRRSSKEMVHQWLRDNGWLDRAQESDEEPPSAEPTRAPRKAPKRHQAAIDALNALPEKHRDAAAEAFGRRLAELALGE